MKKTKSNFILLISLIVMTVFGSCKSQTGGDNTDSNGGQTEENDSLKAYHEKMAWFRDARFGMFIHWGPVSVHGTEIGWSRGGERPGRGGTGSVPLEVYDNLYKQFDPVKFDPDAWVQLAKDAGMKYMVFTTKHHDGFCMFDSKLTDYKITSPESPYGKDIVKMLADAAHRAGMPIGFYYSQPDWHHPDPFTENHERYIDYYHGQVREILTKYGKIDILWFDGLGTEAEKWDAENLYAMARELQPGIIINNRAGIPGDFETPEQKIGAYDRDKYFESCITIGNQWSYKPDDDIKSVKYSLHTLIRTVGNNGNLLYNVGPMPDGRIEPRQADILRSMGDWLKPRGEGIYGTLGGPFRPTLNTVSTCKDDKIYLHVLDFLGLQSVEISELPVGIKTVKLMGGGKLHMEKSAKGHRISVPKAMRDSISTIIIIEVEGKATELPIMDMPVGYCSHQKPATATQAFDSKHRDYGPDKLVDGDFYTLYAAQKDSSRAWAVIDLEGTCKINRALISEHTYRKVRSFSIEGLVDGQWVSLYEGSGIGQSLVVRFPAVETSKVRLNINEVLDDDRPIVLAEFQVAFAEEGM